jgi:S-adenosylmethionine:tRNA ribosyltransferase-isomerase
MKTSILDYPFDKKQIALYPRERREDSRLMIVNRKARTIEHAVFSSIGDYLNPGDVLVYNNTKVLPNRIISKIKGGGRVEILFLTNPHKTDEHRCLIKSKKRLPIGEKIVLENDEIVHILNVHGEGCYTITFSVENELHYFEKKGLLPLPPYIKRDYERDLDDVRYQTVFAEHEGAIASPTASLHFSKDLIATLQHQGIIFTPVTLHVGIGTFKPIKTDDIESHTMHAEYFKIPGDSANLINQVRQKGRRVIAIGTTVVRTLESAQKIKGEIRESEGDTHLFIYPGYAITICDAMITNFHQPRSSLLALVSAFCDREFLMQAYNEALEKNYRLFSYGDAMLIV